MPKQNQKKHAKSKTKLASKVKKLAERVARRAQGPRLVRAPRVVRARGRGASAYLKLLQDPLNADAVGIPDGYHSETVPVKLCAAGINTVTDDLGRSTQLIVPWAVGANVGLMGYSFSTEDSSATDSDNAYQAATPLVFNQVTNSDYGTLSSAWKTTVGASPDVGFNWCMSNSTQITTGASKGTSLAPSFFPGLSSSYVLANNPFLTTYEKARFVCSAVQFTYIGPHGDSQKGNLFVNGSMLGLPEDGCSHFKTKSELKSHRGTQQIRIGADFVLRCYPASHEGTMFFDLRNVPSPVGSNAHATQFGRPSFVGPVGGVSSGAAVAYESGSAAYAANVFQGTTIGSGYAQIGDMSEAVGISGAYNLTGVSPDTVIQARQRGALQGGVFGQMPCLYVLYENGPANTPLYEIKIVTNLECIPQPAVAPWISSMESKDNEEDMKVARKVCAVAGNFATTLAGELIGYSAPFASAAFGPAAGFAASFISKALK